MHHYSLHGLNVVRFWDGFDNLWIDVTDSVFLEEAAAVWGEKTANGTKNTTYNDIDYYDIFPADTVMVCSPQSLVEEE